MVQVRHYERFKPLRLEEGGLAGGYKDIQAGDCVVAFSRRHIYDIKHSIEVATGQRCASGRAVLRCHSTNRAAENVCVMLSSGQSCEPVGVMPAALFACPT